MSARMSHRKPGTGSVSYCEGRWVAIAPQNGDQLGRRLGRFDFKHQAEQALTDYVAANAANGVEVAS